MIDVEPEVWYCAKCGEMHCGEEDMKLAVDFGDGEGVKVFCKCLTTEEAFGLFFALIEDDDAFES